MPTGTAIRVVAVVPAYQAGSQVAQVVAELLRVWPDCGGPTPVIVVDDGSTDETAERARASGAVVLRHATNRGKGAALRTGLRAALELEAAAAVGVDADGQHPASEAVRLALHPAPAAALILGVRDLAGAGAPGPNRFSNALSNYFLSLFAGCRLRDTQCGLRRYPIGATLELGAKADGYAFEAEVLLRAARAGWHIEQVPVSVVYPPRAERLSHFDVVRDPARIIATVLATMFDTWRRP